MEFKDIMYLAVFLLSIPVTYRIVMASNLDKIFKQGSIIEIRLAYLFSIFFSSHLLASLVSRITEIIAN